MQGVQPPPHKCAGTLITYAPRGQDTGVHHPSGVRTCAHHDTNTCTQYPLVAIGVFHSRSGVPPQMAPALQLLHDRCAESAAGLLVAEEMDQLVNVFAPACAAIGWQVRRCYWEGRHRGSGVWAAEALRMCLLLLCGLLGDKAKLSEYARSISVALLAWTPWHDAVPAAAYVEEACEAQLSKLASALTRNPHATGVAEVSDLYVLLPRADEQPHPAKHHPVSQPLLRALLANLNHFVAMGPEVVTSVPGGAGRHASPRASFGLGRAPCGPPGPPPPRRCGPCCCTPCRGYPGATR